MKRTVAIVGSGPGGMYAAQGLLDREPDCVVDVIERLPSPYGLIRGGVAPDHQKTKRVSRAYDRTMEDARLRYLGNVEVGRDVRVDELLEIYDAVVLAYGAPHDNRLGIPGESLANVFGSNAFVGWYNGHPDFAALGPDLDVGAVAVIGVGNVALDVARVLAKTCREMSVTDLAPHAAKAIHAAPIADIHMFGRRGPVEAAFTNVELREMAELEDACPVIDPAHYPETVVAPRLSDRDLRLRQRNVETMKSFAGIDPRGKSKRVHFSFFASPVAILGTERVEGVRLERTVVDDRGKVAGTGERFEVPCQLAVTCIGSRAKPIDGLPFDERRGVVVHDRGLVSPRLYAVGWLKRGAVGTIGTNKNDSLEVAGRVVSDWNGPARPGRAAMDGLVEERGLEVVTFPDWRIIERLEIDAAPAGAPRRKFPSPRAMLSALAAATR